jgi:hypothetical protein
VVLEDQPKRLPDAGVVIYDEDDGARHAGTLAPIPAALAATSGSTATYGFRFRDSETVSDARH